MANQYSNSEYAYIEEVLDEKIAAGDGTVDLILNFLGDGLCAWCGHEVAQGPTNWCEDCVMAFESLNEEYNSN